MLTVQYKPHAITGTIYQVKLKTIVVFNKVLLLQDWINKQSTKGSVAKITSQIIMMDVD